MRKAFTLLIVLGLLAGAGYAIYLWQASQTQNSLDSYQTVLAARGNLTATIGATGVVRSNQNAVLTWQTSGTVEQVDAQAGDLVEADQVLANLEETSLPQNVILAQVDLNNAQKALEELYDTQLAQVQALQSIREAERILIEAERAIDEYEEENFEYKLERAEKDIEEAMDEVELAKENLELYSDRPEDDTIRQYYDDQLTEKERDYDEAVRKHEVLLLERETASTNLEAAKTRLEEAEAEYERLKNGPDSTEISNLEARITAAQATLNLAKITAPFTGTITEVRLKEGDQAVPGAVVFQIDDLTRLLVDTLVSEVDINRVKVGQEASLSFDAIPGREYKGLVMEVARVGTSTQGVVDFNVTIELVDADEAVKPGMTAAVNIVVNQLDDVLLVPNRAVRVKDGRRVVYILSGDQLVFVEIELGASSDTSSQVLNGDLKEGDQIVLNPPVEFESNGPPPFVR